MGLLNFAWLRPVSKESFQLLIAAASVLLACAAGLTGLNLTSASVSTAFSTVASPDAAIRLGTFLAPRSGNAPISIVDVDEATYQAWGSRSSLPRDELFQIVTRIATRQPRAMILDIDLINTDSAEMPLVSSALEKYSVASGLPPMLLVRPLRVTTSEGFVKETVKDVNSPLDPIVAKAPNLRWVSARFGIDSSGVLRTWRMFDAACAYGAPRGYPHVGTAIVSLVTEGATGLKALDQETQRWARAVCAGQTASSLKGIYHREGEEIYAPFPYRFAADEHDAGTSWKRVSAQEILKSEDIDEQLFNNRIVVVGASHEEARDIHLTPIGYQAGVYTIANLAAVASGVLLGPPNAQLAHRALGLLFFMFSFIPTFVLRGSFGAIVSGIIIVFGLVFLLASGVSPDVVYESATAGIGMFGIYFATSLILSNFLRISGLQDSGYKPIHKRLFHPNTMSEDFLLIHGMLKSWFAGGKKTP